MLCAPCGCLWSLLGVFPCLLGRPCWGHTVDTPWSREQSLPLEGENLQMCMESQQHPFKHPTAAEQTWWACGLVLSHAQVSLFVPLLHLTLLWIPKSLILMPFLSQSSLWALSLLRTCGCCSEKAKPSSPTSTLPLRRSEEGGQEGGRGEGVIYGTGSTFLTPSFALLPWIRFLSSLPS